MAHAIVGVTGEADHVREVPAEESRMYGVPTTYVDALQAVDASVVILPPRGTSAAAVDRLDALVLSGGSDIPPRRYGAEPVHPTVMTGDRDDSEFAVLSRALEVGIPILGVCRGMQMLAVQFGGRLHQHLPDVLGHDGHRPAGKPGQHEVRIAGASRLAEVFGARHLVNSYHHQGVADPGELIPTAWAPDGLIEALEHPHHRFVVGVQWHPEKTAHDRPLFLRLVELAVGTPVA